MDRLCITLNHEDEWPLWVEKFIVHLSEWYASHPSFTQQSTTDIATFLDSVLFDEGLIHDVSSISIEPDITSQTLRNNPRLILRPSWIAYHTVQARHYTVNVHRPPCIVPCFGKCGI